MATTKENWSLGLFYSWLYNHESKMLHIQWNPPHGHPRFLLSMCGRLRRDLDYMVPLYLPAGPGNPTDPVCGHCARIMEARMKEEEESGGSGYGI